MQIISKITERSNLISGGRLPSEAARNPLDFEKKIPGVRVVVGVVVVGPGA